MNLNEKAKLKESCESLEMLLSCIDKDWTAEHIQLDLNAQASFMLSHLIMATQGNRKLALNLLLRMLTQLIPQIKQEAL